jgi:hypothetical protein
MLQRCKTELQPLPSLEKIDGLNYLFPYIFVRSLPKKGLFALDEPYTVKHHLIDSR